MDDLTGRAPRHLWIVGILAVLCNAIGAFDYSASQLRFEPYMSQFTPEQLEYFYSFPTWAVACWAIAVRFALAGSVGLLLRKAWAVWIFGIAIVAMVLTGVYSYVLTDGQYDTPDVRPLDHDSIIGMAALHRRMVQVADTRSPDSTPFARANVGKVPWHAHAAAPLMARNL